ncbi:mammalian cell entry protein [Mycobacteriaceae bacterium 1482268.1]|nr:mammalian cell entry protein [Mycobacteriaceae bacterium 1482268.1]
MADRTFWRSVRRRPLESYNATWLGSIALAVVGVLIAAMLVINVAHVGYRHYTAEFLQAAALKPGNPVSVAGIPVGKVTSMKLAGDHVEAGIQVRNDVALGKNSRAIIKITTILGSRYLALEPEGGGPLPNNTFDLAHTEVPYDLQEALADVTTTYEQVDTDSFAQSLAILGQQLSGLPPVVPQAVHNIQTLSSIMAQRRDQLGTLLKSTEQVSSTLRRQQANIGNMINQGQALIGRFVASSATFHAMMQALTRLIETLSPILVDNHADLNATLKDLRQLSDMLGQHDDLVRSTLQSAPVALRGLANASGSGNAFDLNTPSGLAVDSWMCAISGRAKQFGMIQYYKDCK